MEKGNARGFFAFIRQKKEQKGRLRLGFPQEVRIFSMEAAVLPAKNLPATLHKMGN